MARRFVDLSLRELHEIFRLRNEVFVVEQACVYNDIDGRDAEAGTLHHWVAIDDDIATYARSLQDSKATRIGRVVTDPRHRGQGLGAKLMRHVVESCDGPFVLDAQTHLVPWYESLGFHVDGPGFIDDGIPHTPMRMG